MAHPKAVAMDKIAKDIKLFLDSNGHTAETPKFLGMTFVVFISLPVHALRAMGVADSFICDHHDLVEKVVKRWKLQHGKQQQQKDSSLQKRAEKEDRLRFRQRGGASVRSQSPDYTYHTPAVPPDTVYVTYQPRLGEMCCGNSEGVAHTREQSRESRCAKPSRRKQQLSLNGR